MESSPRRRSRGGNAPASPPHGQPGEPRPLPCRVAGSSVCRSAGSALPGCLDSSLSASAPPPGEASRSARSTASRSGTPDARSAVSCGPNSAGTAARPQPRQRQRVLRDAAAPHLAAPGPVPDEAPIVPADNRRMHRRVALRQTPEYATASGCLLSTFLRAMTHAPCPLPRMAGRPPVTPVIRGPAAAQGWHIQIVEINQTEIHPVPRIHPLLDTATPPLPFTNGRTRCNRRSPVKPCVKRGQSSASFRFQMTKINGLAGIKG